ncbi:hypothetical protein E2C01_045331 [Portunus trituberculatus]|uniref:Uncharacterized protein n=1 Tax=Portunus trituberculatus TaxID=210409 RepID=A0A5B7G1Y3_PORTR|nr:hypothetical protein [Portunus trituberculatus]
MGEESASASRECKCEQRAQVTFSHFEATSGNPRDPEGGNGTPSDVMSVLLSNDNENSDFFLLRQKKVKTPVVILIVIWETETNPQSNIHKPPYVLPTSNALNTIKFE